MQTLLLFASLLEAEATCRVLRAQEEHPGLYRFEGGAILITGWGVLNALSATLRFGPSFDLLWNLGFAGSLGTLEPGTIVSIGTLDRHIQFPETTGERSKGLAKGLTPTLRAEGEGRLLTVDFPLHDEALCQELSKQWDLVDMEGYAIAHAAKELGKPALFHKVVSDIAHPGGHQILHTHAATWSEQLSQLLTTQF